MTSPTSYLNQIVIQLLNINNFNIKKNINIIIINKIKKKIFFYFINLFIIYSYYFY